MRLASGIHVPDYYRRDRIIEIIDPRRMPPLPDVGRLPPLRCAWAYVQSTGGGADASATTIAQAYGSNVTAGSLLVAFVGWYDDPGTETLNSVTDSLSQTWTRISTTIIWASTGGDWAMGMFYFANSAAGTTPTVTATWSAARSYRSILIAEYSGVATSSPLDVNARQSQINPNTGTDAITSGNTASTAEANELVVGGMITIGGGAPTISAGTGFTGRSTVSANAFTKMMNEDLNLASPGVTAATFTFNSTTEDTGTYCAAFKQAAAASGWGPLIAGQRNVLVAN